MQTGKTTLILKVHALTLMAIEAVDVQAVFKGTGKKVKRLVKVQFG